MTIGINGNEANVQHRVGVGQYAYELLSHLYLLRSDTTKFKIYLSAQPMSDMPVADTNWSYDIFGPGRLWTLTGLQKKLLLEKSQGVAPEVFFTPSHYTPLFMPVKSVLSIMDLSMETFPQYFKTKDRWQLKYWTQASLKSAAKVLTISNFTKKELHRLYKVPESKIVVTPLGYDTERFNMSVTSSASKAKIKKVLEKYKITQNYFIFLGTLQPKKNLTRLIESFAQLERTDLQLVIVGMSSEGRGGWMYQQFFNRVQELGLDKRIIFTGYAPDEDVPLLFAGSIAFVLPSLYEGFGIPPIEAMATGVPVVVSNAGSLPEVCGPAAIYIDNPTNTTSIKSSLEQVLSLTPSQRTKQIQLGLDFVKRYNWSITAKQTLEALQHV